MVGHFFYCPLEKPRLKCKNNPYESVKLKNDHKEASPLIWRKAIDELLEKLFEKGRNCFDCADNTVIMGRGKILKAPFVTWYKMGLKYRKDGESHVTKYKG